MKNTKNAAHLVSELRKIIGKSQSQFAAMIGVSKDTVISVENGRNQLSRNLAKRIEIATGADLLSANLQSPFKVADYTRADFDRWRDKYGQTNKASALKQFEQMKTWLKVVFLAAAKAGRAGNRDRLPAVCLSLAEWLNEARANFRLEDEIEDVLEDETRSIGRSAHSISHLLEHPAESEKKLAEHGIDFKKIKKELKKHKFGGWLIVEDEFRSAWDLTSSPWRVTCETRKLIPSAKYWIKTIKPGLEAFDELSTYLESLNSGNPTIPTKSSVV